MPSLKFHSRFRQYHRWLGFFLAGIMLIYAVSGTLLIFRGTNFLKYEKSSETQLDAGLSATELAVQLRLRDFRVTGEDDAGITFAQGYYDKASGNTVVRSKDYPAPLAKLIKLHKASTNSPLFFLNIFFAASLLFFVVSAFLMFLPKVPLFRNGLVIAGVGALFALFVVLFGS